MILPGGTKVALALVIVGLCLFGRAASHFGAIFYEFQVEAFSVRWALIAGLSAWCGAFIFLTFGLKDSWLIGLLSVAIVFYFAGQDESQRGIEVLILLAGVAVGKGAGVFFRGAGKLRNAKGGRVLDTEKIAIPNCRVGFRADEIKSNDENGSEIRYLLMGLAGLLAFASPWHLDLPGVYHGPRWMGPWNNPNIFGMLMGVGLLLAIGLIAELQKTRLRTNGSSLIFLIITTGMIFTGLLFSYSRGAWLGAVTGLSYLAWSYCKVKWRFLMPLFLAGMVGLIFLWHSTMDASAWYLKRLDFSRPSAQHRVSAWRGAIQMMRDHPLGVGWNKAADVYGKDYSPPDGGAAAISMNSYLVLGTELGLPGLFCFVGYVGLSLISRPGSKSGGSGHGILDLPQVACRAGAVVLLVAFWFDGGMFDLPTAIVFWILLELGVSDRLSRGKAAEKI